MNKYINIIISFIIIFMCSCRTTPVDKNAQDLSGCGEGAKFALNIKIQIGDNTYDQSKETVIDNIIESVTSIFGAE